MVNWNDYFKRGIVIASENVGKVFEKKLKTLFTGIVTLLIAGLYFY